MLIGEPDQQFIEILLQALDALVNGQDHDFAITSKLLLQGLANLTPQGVAAIFRLGKFQPNR